MKELANFKAMAENRTDRFTAGRYLQALAIAKGNLSGAIAYAEGQGQWWSDQGRIVGALKGAVTAMAVGDTLAANPVGEAFLAAVRSFSVPMRLTNLRRVPMRTRLLIDSAGIVAVRVAEGTGIPVLKGNWISTTLEPIKHAGIVVQTDDLLKSSSALAAAAITDDLAAAVAEAENLSFVSPDHVGSVLYGTPHFNAGSSAIADIDVDLQRLVNLVPGAFRPGAAFVMTQETATALSVLRGSGGAAAYPNIGPQGGELMGLPVIITSACQQVGSPPTRVIGLINPSEIYWADDGGVELMTSTEALLEQVDSPTGNSKTATPSNAISMFQTNTAALKAVKHSSWYARAGAGAYFVAGY